MRRQVRLTVWFAALIVLVSSAVGAQDTGRLLVMPFDNGSRDRSLVWLGEAAAVLLTDELNAIGANAITRDERRLAFEQLQVPPLASLTDATVFRIAQLVGASAVVRGSVTLAEGVITARARAVTVDTARLRSDTTEQGPVAEIFATFSRIAAAVAPGRPARPAGQHPPVAAFENYVKGLVAETPATAVQYQNAALRADPFFDRARLALWDVYDAQDDHVRALQAVSVVGATSAQARRSRFLAGLSQLNLQRHDDAFATFKALADMRPTASVLNNLGVVQLRRSPNTQAGTPTYFFTKASEADPVDPDYFFNLGYAYWQARDLPAAIYALREALRRDPADGEAHFVLSAALQASGNAAEAARERELARRLSSAFDEWARRPVQDPIPRGLERVKDGIELPHAARIEETLTMSGQRDQRELAGFYLDRGVRMFEQERDREALAELGRALFLSPYQAKAHLIVGRIHLRAGRLREAIDALKISVWSDATAEAHAVLAQAYADSGDAISARREAAAALALDPNQALASSVLTKLDAR